jgi:hypothetical protein
VRVWRRRVKIRLSPGSGNYAGGKKLPVNPAREQAARLPYGWQPTATLYREPCRRMLAKAVWKATASGLAFPAASTE